LSIVAEALSDEPLSSPGLLGDGGGGAMLRGAMTRGDRADDAPLASSAAVAVPTAEEQPLAEAAAVTSVRSPEALRTKRPLAALSARCGGARGVTCAGIE